MGIGIVFGNILKRFFQIKRLCNQSTKERARGGNALRRFFFSGRFFLVKAGEELSDIINLDVLSSKPGISEIVEAGRAFC